MRDPLSARVLVLNRLWQAVNIVGARRAFGLLFQEHARVIHVDSENFQVMAPDEWIDYCVAHPDSPGDTAILHTVNLNIRVPKILLLNGYDRLPMKEVKFCRQTIFERDGYVCQYCGEQFPEQKLNLDHVIPRDRGGRTSWENIVTSCVHCNSRKANRAPHEARMRLKRKPGRPRFRPFVSFMVGTEEHREPCWDTFLKVTGS